MGDDDESTGLRRRVAARVYYGWVIAGACFLGSLVVFGMSYSFGVFADRLAESFVASRAQVSMVYGVHTFVLFLGAPFVGGLVDRYGPRRTLLAGSALLGLGLAGASRAGSLLSFGVAYGLVVALGLSAVYVVAYATVPRWFQRRRGTATGIATSGLGAGLLAVPPGASALVSAVGWRATFLVLAAVLVTILAVVAALIVDGPDAVGADASVEFPDGRPEREPLAPHERAVRVWSVARSRPFLLVLGGWVCVYGTLYVVLGHLVFYVTDAGMARWVGVWAIGAIGVVTSLARLGVGRLSDRIGRVRTFVACSASMGLAVAALSLATVPTLVFVVAVVFAIGYGGNGALLSPLVADLFGETDLATLFGAMSLAFAVSGLLAPSLAGAAHDALGTYVPVFLTVGALGLVGAGLVRAAGRFQRDRVAG